MARRRQVRPHVLQAATSSIRVTAAPTTDAAGRPTPTGASLTPAQQKKAIGIVTTLPTQVGQGITNAASTAVGDLATGWIRAIAPYLKIAIGGLGLMVSGVTIVYVAGRKSGVGGAVGAVAGGPAGKVVSAATHRRAAPAHRRAAPAPRTPARPDVAHDRERARRARLETVQAKASTARSEARVSRAYAVEARRAKGAKVLNRPKALPPRSRPKRTTGVAA